MTRQANIFEVSYWYDSTVAFDAGTVDDVDHVVERVLQ